MSDTHPTPEQATGLSTQQAPDRDTLDRLISGYEELREKCHTAARADAGQLMGDDAWLRNALRESDLELRVVADGIECRGYTYTTQTMDNEPFEFTVPFDRL